MTITLHELEAAINYWRHRFPSSNNALCLCAEAAALAVPYAQLIISRQEQIEESALSSEARAALEGWRAVAGAHPVQDR